MKNRRLTHIDMLELIAMFFVVLYHSTLYSYDFLEQSDFTHYFCYYFRTIFSTCVPLFLFANGYLLFSKEFILRKHILKMVKLIIQTIIWAIITLFLLQVINREFFSLTDFIKAIWQLKLGWINHLWYMGALICIYVFFPLLKSVYDNNYKLFLFFTIVCAILTFGNTFLNNIGTVLANTFLKDSIVLQDKNFFNIFNPFRGIRGYTFVYFCLGGIAHTFEHHIEKINIKKRNIISTTGMFISCLGLFAVGICYSQGMGTIYDIVWNGYDSIFTFVNVVFIYVLSMNWKKNMRGVRLISNNTLGIYFIHNIFICLFKPMISNFDFLKNIPFNLIFATSILLLSLTICLILRKIPIVSKLVK